MKAKDKLRARDIINYIKSFKTIVTLVYRFEPGRFSLRGVPDLFVCTTLDNYWVEVKMDHDKLSLMQRRFLQAVKKPVVLEVKNKTREINIYIKHNAVYSQNLFSSLTDLLCLTTRVKWTLNSYPLQEAPGYDL